MIQDIRDLLGQLVLTHLSRFSDIRRVPIVGTLLHHVSHQVLPSGNQVWVQIQEGLGKDLWLKLNPRTGRDYYEGKVEPAVQGFLKEYLRSGMVFYDLGANIGFFSLIAARLVGREGKVFAFEPEAEVIKRLKENIKYNGFDNVVVVEAAVWSTAGTATFLRANPCDSPDLGLGKITLSSFSDNENVVVVPTIALDNFVHKALPPHLIKCDVEDAEMEVFQGAQKVLAKYRPIIVCEIHSDNNRVMLQQLFEGLRYNLKFFDIHHLLALP